MDLQKLEIGKPFTANDKTYIPTDYISIGRVEFLEKLKDEFIAQKNQNAVHQLFLSAMRNINECSPGDAFNELYKEVQPATIADKEMILPKKITEYQYLFRVAACFINEEYEDPRYINEAIVTDKLKDWAVIDFRSLFDFAMSRLGLQ
jgi:hypothetical protein